MILLVDNYDSFTYNLAQYIGEFAHEVVIKRNDAPDLFDSATQADGIILSPGPGTPSTAGNMQELIRISHQTKPILGICLGHEGIGQFFGAKLVIAESVMHGKVSKISQNGGAIFQQLPDELTVMRYHSLVLLKEHFPETLTILATSMDDHEIMALKVKDYPVYGLQFHPESIGTPNGKKMIENFIKETRKETKVND